MNHQGDSADYTLSDTAESRVAYRWLFAIMFAAVFLQRFAVPISADGIPLNLFVTLLSVGVLLFRNQLEVDPVRGVLVLLFAAYALIGAAFNTAPASWLSAALVIATYLPFAFQLRRCDAIFEDSLRAYQVMALVCAICGIAQFALQFVVSSDILYTFQGSLPRQILLEGFETFQRIQYGSPLSRSNGFFMLEPSIFSQFIALAVIIEMVFFQVKWRLVVYGAALLFSYSGTGLIALVLVPGILVSRRSYGTLVVLIVFACVVMATPDLLHLDVAQNRASEFNSTESSAHARFLAPGDLLGRYLFSNSQGFIFGMGPGLLRTYISLMPYETHDPAWAKLLFEYGLLGSLLFWALFIPAVFGRSPSMWMSTALTIGFLSFGGELLDPRLNALLLVFCVLPKRSPVAFAHSFPTIPMAAHPI